jgi:ankyrin repeat protein
MAGKHSMNLAERALHELLTMEDINQATKEMLETQLTARGNTVLYCAAASCSIEIVQAILDKGVNPNNGLLSSSSSTDDKCSPLMIAAMHKKWDIVLLLLARGANATLLNYQKWNVLHYAAEKCAPDDIIKSLILAGADPKGKNSDRRTPADIARERGYLSTASYIEHFHETSIKSANFIA